LLSIYADNSANIVAAICASASAYVQVGRIVRGESWQGSHSLRGGRAAEILSPEDLAASAQRMLYLQEQLKNPLPPEERKPPPSLLDGAEAPDETAGTGTSALERAKKTFGLDLP